MYCKFCIMNFALLKLHCMHWFLGLMINWKVVGLLSLCHGCIGAFQSDHYNHDLQWSTGEVDDTSTSSELVKGSTSDNRNHLHITSVLAWSVEIVRRAVWPLQCPGIWWLMGCLDYYTGWQWGIRLSFFGMTMGYLCAEPYLDSVMDQTQRAINKVINWRQKIGLHVNLEKTVLYNILHEETQAEILQRFADKRLEHKSQFS